MSDLADFDWYTGNLSWLKNRTIFLTKHGSTAYGTNLPTSDLDIKGVAVAPREYYLGFLHSFEQAESRGAMDSVVYDIRKFFKLAADCNPNIIELLFVDQSDWILATGYWDDIYRHRDLFLSQKVQHTFSGYAVAQLKRINTHRSYLLNPPKKKPERADYGLKNEPTLGKDQLGIISSQVRRLEDAVAGEGKNKAEVAEMEDDLVFQAVDKLNLTRDLIPIILAERRYGNACRNWDSYQKWQDERNPMRAELEAKFGYDTKHAMHLVRLLRMAIEILQDGKVLVKRPDAEELLAIRNGAWSYQQLIDFSNSAQFDIEVVVASSPLPKAPNRKRLDEILIRTIWMGLNLVG